MNKYIKLSVGLALAAAVIGTAYWALIEYVLKDYQNMPYIIFKYTYSGLGDDAKKEVTIMNIDRDKKYPANFEVPSKLLGYPVTTIGEYAFAGLDRLETVTLPSTVTTIQTGAFSNCENLTEIKNRSHSVVNIGTDAFLGSKNWVGYNQEGLITVGAILYKYNGEIEEGTVIKDKKDKLAEDIEEKTIYIEDYITGIAEGAFANQPGIVSISLPSRFTEIKENLLLNCVNLEEVQFDSIKRIGNNAFKGCVKLSEVSLNSDIIEYIGENAFESTDIKNFEFSDKLTSISDGLFKNCEMLENVEIPSTITTIGREAFMGCKALTSINTHGTEKIENEIDSISIIGERAFAQTGLTEIVLPKNLESIGKATFADCSNLTEVILPNVEAKVDEFGAPILDLVGNPAYYGIKKISEEAFKNSINLQTVIFPKLDKSIDGKNVIINTLADIGNNAFENTSITSIEFPASLSAISSEVVKNCTKLETITFQDYSSHMYVGESKMVAPVVKSVPNYTEIKTSAFEGTTSLKEIVIPNAVKAVFDSVFKNSGVEKITLPESNSEFQTINISTFENCINLTDINIPSSITTVMEKAFKNCTSLTSLYFYNKIKTIYNYVFIGCSPDLVLNFEVSEQPTTFKEFWACYETYDNVEKKTVIVNFGVPRP